MTREEAIKILQPVISCSSDYMDYLDKEDVEAIRTLAGERPRVIPVATIKLGDEKTLKLVKEAVDRARPRGEWSTLEYGYKCSACTAAFYTHSNFCPNCGADMREGGEK